MRMVPTDGRPVSYVLEMIRCGKPGCRKCPHGPYWYAYWKWAGRTKKKYIGKVLPEKDRLNPFGRIEPSGSNGMPEETRETPRPDPVLGGEIAPPKKEMAGRFQGPDGRKEIIACMRSMKGMAREKARKKFWNMRSQLARDPAGNAAKIAFAEGAFEELCRQEGWAPPKGGR